MTNVPDCAVCALIRDGSALGRDELWRTNDAIAYVCAFDADSVEQVAVAPLRHATSPVDLTDAEFTSLMIAARDAGTALTRVLDPDGVTLHAHIGEVERQPTSHFELLLGAKAFGSEFGELPRDYRQEPWVLTDAVVADWNQTYELRMEIVSKLGEALGQ